MGRLYSTPNGPFTADQVKPGDPYELSNGHAIHCLPSDGRRSGANAEGEAKGLELSDNDRTRIAECTDLDQLKLWFGRVATAETADGLFV